MYTINNTHGPRPHRMSLHHVGIIVARDALNAMARIFTAKAAESTKEKQKFNHS